MKKMIAMTGFLFLVILLINSCGGPLSKSASPSDVVKKAYDLMASKDYKAVAELYVSEEGKPLTTDESKKMEGLLGMASSKNEEKGGIKEVQIIEESISEDGNKAEVKSKIIFNNGTEDTDHAKLVKVDGKWYFVLSLN